MDDAPLDRLSKLKSLLDGGAINQREFDELKSKLLDEDNDKMSGSGGANPVRPMGPRTLTFKAIAIRSMALSVLLFFAFVFYEIGPIKFSSPVSMTLTVMPGNAGPFLVLPSMLEFTNVGNFPVRVLKVNVNDRPECIEESFNQAETVDLMGRSVHRQLAEGESLMVIIACPNSKVVKVTVSTDQGLVRWFFEN